MIATCRLCGQIIKSSILITPEATLLGVDPEQMEYQATILELMRHIGATHPAYIHVLAGTAQTYHYHLVAKLADSTDEKFNRAREDARALAYWSLAGKMELDPVVPAPISSIPKA